MTELIVVGGGLAGSEAAWQAAECGIQVILFEMRPRETTAAHVTPYLAELVCSNSLGSILPDHASGVLKAELHRLRSLVLECAEQTALPAGSALAVDRQAFSQLVTEKIQSHPNITLCREEVIKIPAQPVIIASGPLTSPSLARALQVMTGQAHLYFYDAIAPIVSLESIDLGISFRGSRYGLGEQEAGDYINCPLTQVEYDRFVGELVNAERIELREFERDLEAEVRAGGNAFFEGCLPIEILARRGKEALAFGPLRPVGLVDPRTNQHLAAVVQLRQDNLAGSLYNMVGFQTNLKFSEQKRIFRMIPGLERAEFERFGQMHRNTFLFSPALLLPTLQFQSRMDLFFAGQLTGVEGYVGNIATGLLAGLNAARFLHGEPLIELPPTTILGALCYYITHASQADFQPMKANFGLLPPLAGRIPLGRKQRSAAYAERARNDFEQYLLSLAL